MTNDEQAGIEDPDENAVPQRTSRFGARTMTWLAAGLSVVVVAALVVAALAFTSHRHADQQVRARADALASADSFVLAMDDVDGAKFDAYIARVDKLLTTKARTKNLEGLQALKAVYEKGKVKGTGKVLMSGVGDSDLDSATVLVVHDTAVSSTAGKVVHHYRWTVSMEKIGSRWLVDDFTPTSGGTS